MSVAVYVAAFIVIVVATTVQSSIGFGANLIAMPTLALFAPQLVPAAALLAISTMNVFMLRREHTALEVSPIANALVGRVIGTAIAVFVLAQVSEDRLDAVIGVSVLGLVAATAYGGAPERTRATMLGAGTISGFTAGTAGIGGPPVALMFQKAKGASIRASMGAFFVVGTIITLIGLVIAGELGADEARWGVSLVPAAVVGFFLSGPLLPVVDRGYTRPAILILSAAAAIVLLVRALT
ncbi:MAG: sulfite exporter TauE/SafE family protein [Acidimicrobiales bacterium]|nr:sulfite exporter TauE/SafE family protein [Acidimicrobiales bacterium]RZV44749.1 MAG: sulfite exporter TauE/SafE family protein [Acidimicrobiales bacterium]